MPRPRARPASWSAWRLDAAPLRPSDHAVIARYVRQRALAHSRKLADREERWIVRWTCHLGLRGRTLAQADEDDALAWTDQFDDWHWGASQRGSCMTALRVFHEWLCDRGLAERNPWRRLRPPRAIQRVPRLLRPDEINRMSRALVGPHWRLVRDRALLCTLASTACRIMEVLGLDVADLDLASGWATVCGKGRRERVVPLDAPAREALTIYLQVGRPCLTSAPGGPLFVGRHGGRLSGQVARDALDRAAVRAGVHKDVWPHLFRHSAATDLLNHGADLRHVQALLGHASIRSTERYTHVATDRLREVYDRTHSAVDLVGRREEGASRSPQGQAASGED